MVPVPTGVSSKGYSLLDLLITLAVTGILAAIALPLFSGYFASARETLMVRNIEALALLEEDFRLDRGVYVAGVHDPMNPDGPRSLQRLLGWQPGRGERIVYEVSLETDGYSITATDQVRGTLITRKYP